MQDDAESIARDILINLLAKTLPSAVTINNPEQSLVKKSILRIRGRPYVDSDSPIKSGESPEAVTPGRTDSPLTGRRTGRKRKPSYLSGEYQELRRLVRKGEPVPLEAFLGSLDQDFVNVRDDDGCSLLNEIATKTAQFVRIAEILITHKADVNLVDRMGNAPLHNSLMYYPATHDMVQLLIQHGASIHTRNLSQLTPIQMSDDADLNKYMKSLRKGVDPLTALNTWLKTITGPSGQSNYKVSTSCFNDAEQSTSLPPNPSEPSTPLSNPSIPSNPLEPLIVPCETKQTNDSLGLRGVKRKRESDLHSDLSLDESCSFTSKRIRFVSHDSLGTPIKN